MLKYFLVAAGILLGGCASINRTATAKVGVLVSRLTLAQVKEIAAARARENGFDVDASAPWTLSLRTEPRRVWTAMLQTPGKAPPGYWLLVDDLTGKADFVMPTIEVNAPPVGSDWLIKVQNGLGEIQYPVQAEDLLRHIGVAGMEFDGGGTQPGGRMYLEATLRREPDWPARFELRCYIKTPNKWTDPKFVTAAEIAYIDGKLNRYVLRKANQ